MKLMEHLSEYDKDELKKLGKELGVTLPASENAQKWRERIAETLLTPKMVAARLLELSDSQIALFERACDGMFIPTLSELDDAFAVQDTLCAFPYENDTNPTDIFALLKAYERNPDGDAGLKLAEGFKKMADVWLSVPEEIVPIYREINTPEFQKLRHTVSWMTECLTACGKLYAVTPLSVLAQVYARKEPISEERLRQLLPLYADSPNGWVYDSAHDRVLRWEMGEQEIQSILDRQGDRNFYIPEPDETERIADEYYPITLPAYENFQLFLEQYCDMNIMESKDAVIELWDILSENDSSLQDDLQWMIDQTDVGPKFMPLLTKMYQNCKKCTRCISYRGYTWGEVPPPSDEITVKMGNMELEFYSRPRKIRIGRNDPCPCGSGEKYKKCCGR